MCLVGLKCQLLYLFMVANYIIPNSFYFPSVQHLMTQRTLIYKRYYINLDDFFNSDFIIEQK